MRRWRTLCVRLPGGAWLIGPGVRAVMNAALDDAVAFRTYDELDEPDGCTGCPAPQDNQALAELGVGHLPPCRNHQLDLDAVRAYEHLLDRIALSDGEVAALAAKQAAEARKQPAQPTLWLVD